MGKPIIRPATREDIDAFSSMQNKPTAKAVCMIIDGRIVALGGFARVKSRWFAFCDLTEEARPYKMHIARTAKRMLDEIKGHGIRFIYAQANPDEPGAVRWLTSLGFVEDRRADRLYRWRA